MNTSRPTAVAGLFYPAEPQVLTETLNHLFSQSPEIDKQSCPKAIIAPHAGYQYSGLTAAHVYTQIQPLSDTINRVVLLGPSHRVAFEGMALTEMTHFDTPLDKIEINKDDYPKLLAMDDVFLYEQAHSEEHCIEVQLPFLQRSLKNFTILPIVVGMATPQSVSNVIELLWGGPETLVVISSDLSHHHNYTEAQQLDSQTSKAILDFNFSAIHPHNACGCMAINGLLKFAQRHPLTVKLIAMCNSGDASGSKDKVVGYGAYTFEET